MQVLQVSFLKDESSECKIGIPIWKNKARLTISVVCYNEFLKIEELKNWHLT